MDHLFKSLESFAPILIFVIWMIASVANSQKRKLPKRQTMPQRPEEGTKTDIGSRQSKGRGMIEGLRRSLETIFEEMSTQRDFPQEISQKAQSPETVEPEEISAAKINQKQIENMELEKIYGLPGKEIPMNFVVSQKELRRAVIWSEILSPPVSLRD